MGKLTLTSVQDGLGYFYGTCTTDAGDTVRVDVLPPKSHPRPAFVIDHDGMHESDWIVFVDGEEIGRGASREAAIALIEAALAHQA